MDENTPSVRAEPGEARPSQTPSVRAEPVEARPAPLPLAAFLDAPEASAVRLDPADDPRALIPHFARLALVEIGFATFRDGRGYSQARLLREAGFTGTLRATGDVLVDQVSFMKRCGFNELCPNSPIDPAVETRLASLYAYVYQGAADGAVPVWKLRHG